MTGSHHPHDAGVIEWNAPAGSKPDWLMGAGATTAERALIWIGSIVGVAFVAVMWARDRPDGWALWQYGLAAVIAFDLVGGAVSNAASSTKRQYLGPMASPTSGVARVVRDPIAFTALHLYPFLIVAAYPGGTWWWAALVYAGVVGAVAIVERLVPLYLRRPTAMLLFCSMAMVSLAGSTAPPGWEWFAVVYLAKLLLAHAVPEEPYRPHAGT